MKLTEAFKKFPIYFYKTSEGIYYESAFTKGNAKTIEEALSTFAKKEFTADLIKYYDDVVDVKLGAFVPTTSTRKRKGMESIGKLDVSLDLSPIANSENQVSYLSKHKDKLDNQLTYMQDMKKKERFQKIKNSIKKGVLNIMRKLQGKEMLEMFDPVKSISQTICEHCGQIIPTGIYYEEFKGNDYHLECIWDKLVNKLEHNTYSEAEKFFFSLQKYVGQWPAYGFDVEEDYLSDLELVNANNRYLNKKPQTDYNFLTKSLEYYGDNNETL